MTNCQDQAAGIALYDNYTIVQIKDKGKNSYITNREFEFT